MNKILALGAVADGVAVLATQYLGLPGWWNYVWGGLAVVWGLLMWARK